MKSLPTAFAERSRIRVAAAAVALMAGLACASKAGAQCQGSWNVEPGDSPDTVNAQLINAAVVWDPDGAGPLAPRLVVAGDFSTIGGQTIKNIAQWNGTTWLPVGGNGTINNSILSMAALPTGELVAGGFFNTIDGVSANSIARFNGTSWAPLGSGVGNAMGPRVAAMAVLPDGSLVAGGRFGAAGGVPASNIARWNGTSWSTLGTSAGTTANGVGGFVTAMAVRPDGELFVGGNFANFISANVQTPTRNIARWSPTAGWRTVGAGVTGAVTTSPTYVFAMAVLPNGDLVFGGNFDSFNGNGAPGSLARFDGSALTEISPAGGVLIGDVRALLGLPDGSIIAGGTFAAVGGVTTSAVARFDGTNWSALGSGVSHLTVSPWSVNALARLPDGSVAVGGRFDTAGDAPAGSIALWSPPQAPAVSLQPAPVVVCPTAAPTITAQFDGDGTPAYAWQFRSADTLNQWVTVSNGANDFFGTPLFTAAGATGGSLSLSRATPWAIGGELRVQATGDCGTATATAAITVCRADFDCSGARTIDDIFIFLNAWFAGSPQADVDGNGRTIDDIFIFLNLWFAGC